MKIKILLVLLTLVNFCYGQNTISGVVKSQKTKEPLLGATVVVGSLSTVTEADGMFRINTPLENGSVRVSFVGMETQTVHFSRGAYLEIFLTEAATQLEEVVAIGYGSSRKQDLTTAVANVPNVTSIASRPVSNVNDFLQGAVAGVTVLQQGGDPSRTAKIVIRGMGSLASETPLTVVDGVPYYGPPINPNDIQSISVLKDAASASIYGAQAASGVIVITTKKGKSNKPVVSIDLLGGLQTAANLPTPLTAIQQAQVYNQAADNAGAPRLAAHDAAKNPWGQINRTNWIDAIFRTGKFYNANASISGANDYINYFTSFNYQKKEGLLVGTAFERFAVRLKSDYNITRNLTVGENISYMRSTAVGADNSSSYSGTIINALYMPSAAPVYDSAGLFSGTVPFSLKDFAGAYGDVYNPVALLLRPTASNPVNYIDATVYGKYNILSGLSFKTTFTYGYTDAKSKRFVPRAPELGRTNLQNFLYQNTSSLSRWIWENQLEYAKVIGNGHNINVAIVQSLQSSKYESLNLEGRNFSNEAMFNQYMSNANEVRPPVTSAWGDRLVSTIARAIYNYKSRYYLTASLRRDQTSRLYINNQADIFPSVSGAWNISNESFFPQNDVINNLKIRGSWGRIGNINSVSYYSFDVPLGIQYAVLGAAAADTYKGVYVSREANYNLKWEKAQSLNIGVDFSLVNHFDVTVDYFVKKTLGMILTPIQDLHKGIGASDRNVGTVSNKGLEVTVGYRNTIGKLNYNINANATYIKNNLDDMKGYSATNLTYIAHNTDVRGQLTPYRSSVGQPIYSYFLIPYEGIFNTLADVNNYVKDGKLIQTNAKPGDFKFKDVNNDGVINDADRVYMGSYQPKFTYALSGTFNYGAFDFNIFLQGAAGNKIFNAYKFTAYNASQSGYNLDSRVLNAWTPTNQNTDIPIISTKDNNRNFGTASSWYLERGDYLRIKNITVGYSFKNGLRLFAGVENLKTFTKYSGLDPEIGGIGLDLAEYPVARVINAGLTFKF